MKIDLITRNKNQTEKENMRSDRTISIERTISHTTRTSLRDRDCYEWCWLIGWWRRWLMDWGKKRKQRKEEDENGGSVIERHQEEERKGKDKGVNRQRAAQMILRWCGWWFLQDTRPGWLMIEVGWFAGRDVWEWWVKRAWKDWQSWEILILLYSSGLASKFGADWRVEVLVNVPQQRR